MYSVCGRSARTTLAAPNSLLTAGLRRAADRVGLDVVADDESADVSVRIITPGRVNPRLDIVIDEHSVVMTAALPVDPAALETVFRLLEEIGGDRDPIAPEHGSLS